MSDSEYNRLSSVLRGVWKIFYWSSFFLGWFFFPFLMEYVRSAEFTMKEKIKSALYRNLVYYGIISIIGVFLIIYVWAKGYLGK